MVHLLLYFVFTIKVCPSVVVFCFGSVFPCCWYNCLCIWRNFKPRLCCPNWNYYYCFPAFHQDFLWHSSNDAKCWEDIDKHIIPIYSKGIYNGWFWFWKPVCLYPNLLFQSGYANMSKMLCLPVIWAAKIWVLLWIQNSHTRLAVPLLENNFMSHCFLYMSPSWCCQKRY